MIPRLKPGNFSAAGKKLLTTAPVYGKTKE
jgi:hypothetical protein